MAASSLAPRLTDILEAIGRIRSEMAGVSIEVFEADWRKRWLVEGGDCDRLLTNAGQGVGLRR
jgi:hypothetical protein